MLRYFFKRILIFIPTLIVISLVAFGLSRLAPGDPVLRLMSPPDFKGSSSASLLGYEKEYQLVAKQLNVDKPLFYLTLSSLAYPDTFYRIPLLEHRETLDKLIAQYGNWPLISAYYHELKRFEIELADIPDSLGVEKLREMRRASAQLVIQYKDGRIKKELSELQEAMDSSAQVPAFTRLHYQQIQERYQQIQSNSTRWKLYVPSIKWYGWNNQYHYWITHFLKGDFGVSYMDGQLVVKKVKGAVWWTFIINVMAIIIAFLLAIPLGVYAAVKRGKLFDQLSSLLLFMLYSLPTFWVATLLVVFLTTPEYGQWLDIFPSQGLGQLRDDAPFWARFQERAYHLILPIFCLTYGTLAFIARQMRGGMSNVIKEDYIRTARAKGLDERKVIWKHAFRNSLFPLITLVALVFPAAVSGSVVIERIFNLPGMGNLVIDSIASKDWPTVYTILMLTAIMVMLGNLIADLLYALADPRVSYSSK
ncbi:MAG: ABC transporter permease [Bacteroidota bacterium]